MHQATMVKGRTTNKRDQETEALLQSVAKAVKPFKAGSLANVSLSQLLVYLDSRSLSGSLWLYDPKHDSTVTFVCGAPAKVRTTLEVAPLGELLVESGCIDQRANDETLTFSRRGGGLHGAMLMACGLLDKEGLEAGLRMQTALRLTEIFRNAGASTRFAFYRDVDLLAAWGGVEVTPVDPWWLLWWGNRDRRPDASMRAVLSLLAGERLVLLEHADLSRFGFEDNERAFLSLWSGRASTVDALLSYARLPKTKIAHLIVVLFLTNNLSYAESANTRPSAGPERGASPKSVSPREQHSPRPIAEQTATAAQGNATARLAKAYKSVIEPVEQQREDPKPKRTRTHSELDLSRCSEALRVSKQAQDALDRGELEQAERLAAAALRLLPNNAALKTEYAWVASHLPARRKIGDVGDLIDLLNEATKSEPGLDRAYFVRGTILEYLGLYAQAYAEFRAAFTRNRRNVEAAERLNEYVRRLKETGSPEPESKPTAGPGAANRIGGQAQAVLARFWKRD